MPKADLLHRERVSPVFWEPYIINGYRRTDTSLWQCFKYMFVLHNDLGNIWTHFIPLLIWLYWLYCLSFQLDFTDPFWYPLLAIWIGGCSYVFCSSMAHAFGSKSIATREICFMIDYQGISMYTLGGGIAYYFYERPVGSWLCDHKWCFVGLYTSMSLSATLTASLTRFYWMNWRFWLRAGSYMFPYIFGYLPLLARFYTCYSIGDQCLPADSLTLHNIAFVVSLIMVFFFISKIPEKMAPGRFDYFPQSHQLFHIMSSLLTTLQFYVLPMDATARRNELMKDSYYHPDVYSTLIPFLVVFIVGGLIVTVLGVLLVKGYLYSNLIASKSKFNIN